MTGKLISLFDQNTSPAEVATGQPTGTTLPAPAGWPPPPADDAFHGLPGAIVCGGESAGPPHEFGDRGLACEPRVGRQ